MTDSSMIDPNPETDPQASDERGISRRTVEVVVAVTLIILAGLVLWDSYGRGAAWDGGPETGYFPARVGWLFLAASLYILWRAFQREPEMFASWQQLRHVSRVLLPLIGFVALIKPLGIYSASAVFIVVFMLLSGARNWLSIIAFAVIFPLVCFQIFEVQFLVPLPKGPLESYFGY
ncbi:tripartite tricarboxylate transporter TctB family protein [Terrihabitans sp. B22-R8]|uniref:tripartite tricarboxylate transporter TctB family protein n=1 Tax=Terrihabitans sp. B22-R8 TaxID=3425128 RepID=UPI00403C6DD3